MYAVAKDHRSTKFFVKARRTHIPQKLDTFDTSIKKDAQDLQLKEQLCTISKPLISEKQLQVKNNAAQAQEISSQHEAMIRYIHSSWRGIKQELEYSHKPANGDSHTGTSTTATSNGTVNGAHSRPSKIKYINGCTSSSIPKNFVPFDLESFWGQRIYQNLLQSS